MTMLGFILLVLSTIVLCECSYSKQLNPSGMVLMESQIPRDTFVKGKRANPNTVHEVIIAVQKLNMDKLEAETLVRASPDSSKYQQWMSYDEVTAYVQNIPGFEEIFSWLEDQHVNVTWISKRKDYVKATSSIEHWERLLHTEFYEFSDLSIPAHKLQSSFPTASNNKVHIMHRAESYYLPAHLQPHVYAIFNTVQTPPPYLPKYYMHEKEHLGTPFQTDVVLVPNEAVQYLRSRRKSNTIDKENEGNTKIHPEAAANFPGFVTVAFLNQYYGIVTNNGSSSYSQSVFETSTEYFSPADLTKFQTSFELHVQAAQSIGKHNITSCPVSSTSTTSCYEGNLDIQYIMGVSQVTASIFWWVSGAVYDPFVLWITTMADQTNPPKSNSVSWGANEQLESLQIVQTFNNEAIQLAAMGVTIFASSGDNGVANLNGASKCQCTANSGSSILNWAAPSTTWTGQGYFPNFPATSPYITAAGATQGPEENTEEIACQSQKDGVITTGGGFSTYFTTPSWQSKAVNRYFQQLSKQPATGYNRNGRGIPDVSLIGVKYIIVIGNTFQSVYGTSCTAPVLAAYVSLVNAEREKLGKPTLGWLNPTLYAIGYNQSQSIATLNAAKFNDVVHGNNSCCADGDASKAVCCASGFVASPGWDPVTGWGSVNFTQFALMFDTTINVNSTNTGGGGSVGSSGGGSSSGVSGLSTSAVAAVVVVVLLVVGAGLGMALVWCGVCMCPACFSTSSSSQDTTAGQNGAKYAGEVEQEGNEVEVATVKDKQPTQQQQSAVVPPPLRKKADAAGEQEMASIPYTRNTNTNTATATTTSDAPSNRSAIPPRIPPKPSAPPTVPAHDASATNSGGTAVAAKPPPRVPVASPAPSSPAPGNKRPIATATTTAGGLAEPSWAQTTRRESQPLSPPTSPKPTLQTSSSSSSYNNSAATAPPSAPSIPRPSPQATTNKTHDHNAGTSSSSAAAPAAAATEGSDLNDVYDEEKRIQFANPMAARAKSGRTTSSANNSNSTMSEPDRNSMQRVEMLQRGLSLNRPASSSTSGSGSTNTGAGRGPGMRPAKPSRQNRPVSTSTGAGDNNTTNSA